MRPARDPPSEAVAQRRKYRWRIVAFVLAACVIVGFLSATLWTAGALRRVDAVEAERDRWQRPGDVMEVFDVGEGKVVADLGSGVGYFSLKLTERVCRRGRVLAVDVRRFPLLFLRVRVLLRARRNLTVVHGEVDDPHLPCGGVDAILVANTFHELEDPVAILARARQALRPGGRVVVVDPSPDVDSAEPASGGAHHHEPPDAAEAHLRQAGLEIVARDDGFVDGPGHVRWWLIVARRP